MREIDRMQYSVYLSDTNFDIALENNIFRLNEMEIYEYEDICQYIKQIGQYGMINKIKSLFRVLINNINNLNHETNNINSKIV